MTATIQAQAEPYFETLAMDDEHPSGKVGFVCATCRREVDNQPCRDHAPVEVPGLELVECDATPRHWSWVLASDANGYGIPCWQCEVGRESKARYEDAEQRAKHWTRRWRGWTATRWIISKAHSLGVISGYCLNIGSPTRVAGIYWRGTRTYILGVSRGEWRCWLIGHHRRGEDFGLGFCGKCAPWACCGSQRLNEHQPGCTEDDGHA
jgi:hypothetical protein